MNRIKLCGHASYLALACAATALLAAGCNKSQTTATNTTAPPLDALPLTTTDAPPAAPAPAASALPSARPVRIGRLARPQDGYAYLDRAYAASDGYGDAPPDYAVDYNGERPWIWRGGDESERVVERTPEGLRYYYYEPGASEPYLIQDPNYGYAYSDGQLVAVYGSDGQLEPYDYQQRYADRAGRYLAWAAGLYAASVHQQRFAVEQDGWRRQQAYIAGQRSAWAQQQTQYPAWNDYHQAHVQEEAAHWAPERDRRQAEIVRYSSVYQNNNYQNSNYQSNNYQNNSYQNNSYQNTYRGGPSQGAAVQGQYRQAGQPYGQPGGYQPAGAPQGGYGYDPNAARTAAVQAEASRRAGFDQRAAEVQAQRQAAQQAHAAQMQAQQSQQSQQAQARAAEAQRQSALQQGRAAEQAQRQAAEQAHAAQLQAQRSQQMQARAAEGQRQAALQQGRATEQAQRQAAEQAHAAQLQAQRSQQMQARAAEGQRQAALQQGRAEAEAQRQAALQAHAAQMGQARAQAEAERQAAAQQAHAAEAQRQAAAQQAHLAQAEAEAAQRAAVHPAASPHPHDGPHGDHERHEPGDQR